jgi:hypothetical protein
LLFVYAWLQRYFIRRDDAMALCDDALDDVYLFDALIYFDAHLFDAAYLFDAHLHSLSFYSKTILFTIHSYFAYSIFLFFFSSIFYIPRDGFILPRRYAYFDAYLF